MKEKLDEMLEREVLLYSDGVQFRGNLYYDTTENLYYVTNTLRDIVYFSVDKVIDVSGGIVSVRTVG